MVSAGGPRPARNHHFRLPSRYLSWLWLQLVPLLLYLPWLPTAWRQVTTWPAGQATGSTAAALERILTTLLFGLSWPYDQAAGYVAVGLGLVLAIAAGLTVGRTQARSRQQPYLLLWLWLILPLALVMAIFSPAFLKFLLIASPALLLLLGLTLSRLPLLLKQTWWGYLLGSLTFLVLMMFSMISLSHYYSDAAYARDDYRGIVQFIKSVGSQHDAIVLNAEGQQDVFNYYYEQGPTLAAPVFPLPRRRPLDEVATLIELENIAGRANKIYATYWATHQADPDGLIEGWLDGQLFKATDDWYGNVRLVSYAAPLNSDQAVRPVDFSLGENIRLSGYTAASSEVRPGDILQIILRWEAKTAITKEYTVFLQVLDENNHLVGQRDAAPRIPTRIWSGGETVDDAHGLFIEPGTPPGTYRLTAGLYDSRTGQRLPVSWKDELGQSHTGAVIELGPIEVIRPEIRLPGGAFKIQYPLHSSMAGVSLLGYDLYALGNRSNPTAPLHPGDAVQLVAYWRLDDPGNLPDNQVVIRVESAAGEPVPLSIERQLAGLNYPVFLWKEGEIVRAQYHFFLSDLVSGNYRLIFSVDRPGSGETSEVKTPVFRVER